MKFKDYICDRLLFIFVYVLSTASVIIVMLLDLLIAKAEIRLGNIFYGVFLSLLFLIIGLLVDYSRKRRFYSIITRALDEDEPQEVIFNLPDNITREHDIIKRLFLSSHSKFERVLDKYKNAYKTQLEFKSRWVHQMKTPVSIIKLLLENENEKDMDLQTKKNYDSIEEEVEKLSRGLEMTLHTLKISEFDQDFKVDQMDVVGAVRSIINENKNAFIVNSIYPKINTAQKTIIISDEKWLKFAINQIITNSIKYTKVKESDQKWVQVEIKEDMDKIILSITDNGVGIPKEDLDKVFKAFYTGSNGRKYAESTGMGLYLAKVICDKLGHKIYIESVEGEGTKISLIFYRGKSIYNFND